MRIILYIVFQVVLTYSLSAEVEKTFISPGNKYQCVILRGGSIKEGVHVFLEAIGHEESRSKIYESDRWAEIKWSTNDSWFAIIDHPDGHNSTIDIVKIVKQEGKPFWRTVSVFRSPWPTHSDNYWDVKEWNFQKGVVTLLWRNESSNHGVWKLKEFKMPIEFSEK